MKIQLRKLVGPHRLTYPQLNSIIAEVEATLNSCPLLPIEVDPQEGPQVITPRHFLIGRPLRSLPVKVDLTSNVSGLRRWNLTKRLSSDLWKTWHSKYLQALQSRTKWTSPCCNFKVGDVVLLKDESLLDRSWPMAIITEVFSGPDNLVRVVNLRIKDKVYRRAVDRLVLLLPDESEGDRGEDVEAQGPSA